MSPTIWKIQFDREKDSGNIAALARTLGISPVTAILLWNRGVRDARSASDFLSADVSYLHDPFAMADMDKAVARIGEALRNRDRIVVYGDYDVDGVTSVAVLQDYLASRGADVSYHIPRRDGEGYGINRAAIDELVGGGARLLISVDCGITAVEEVDYARSIGLDVIITDHHECHSELPEALAVVNPRRPDCAFPFKELAGVGVAFNLVCALEIGRRPDERPLLRYGADPSEQFRVRSRIVHDPDAA